MKAILLLFMLSFYVLTSLYSQENNNLSHKSPFIENKGQWDDDVIFRSNFNGGRITFYKNKFRFGFLNHDDLAFIGDKHHNHSSESSQQLNSHIIHGHIYDMRFVGSNETLNVNGFEKQTNYINYFLGKDKSKWAGNVLLYGTILYHNIWDDIDLRIKENQSAYEYDFIVKPGADITKIKLAFDGQSALDIKDGNLLIYTSINTIRENAPYAYQEINGTKVGTPCNYKLDGKLVSFEFPEGYDPDYELVIDPVLVFSTYSGSTADNWGFTATYSNSGNLYSAGIVFGFGYPITTGAFQSTFSYGEADIGITKFTNDGGGLIYSTYLGGSGTEAPQSIIVDNNNNLIVYGITSSSNFPVTNGSFNNTFYGGPSIFHILSYNMGTDMFVSKFNAEGTSLEGSTFVGGSDNDGLNKNDQLIYNYGDQLRGEVFVDIDNSIYVASSTHSTDFPTTPGSLSQTLSGTQDGCAFKLNSDLSELIWSTYIGGSGLDASYNIKISNQNDAIICGGTTSADFPTTANVIKPNYGGEIDGYIVNLNNNTGGLNQATYIGTSFYDQAYFLDIDNDGDLFVMGQTLGLYPVSPDVYSNPNSTQFIHKLTLDLSTTYFSSVFGDGSRASIDISPTAFLVDNCGKIYVSGWGGITSGSSTGSTIGLPVTTDAFQSSTDGKDFYFTVFNRNLQGLLYATFFGGVGVGEHVDGGTSRFDKKGIIYQAVCAGCGGSNNFPTTSGAWSQTNNSYNCNLGSIKMEMGFSGVEAIVETSSDNIGCAPYTIDFFNYSNGVEFIWDFGDGSAISHSENPSHTFINAGVFTVNFIAIDSSLCITADTINIQITVIEPIDLFASFDYVVNCTDMSVTAVNTGTSGIEGISYFWDMGDGTTYTGEMVSHVYAENGTYTIMLTVSNIVCSDNYIVSHHINISTNANSDFVILDSDFNVLNDNTGCSPLQIHFQNNSSGSQFKWDFGDDLPILTEFEPDLLLSDPGIYEINLIVFDSNSCNISDTSSVILEVIEPILLEANFNYYGSCTDSLILFTNTGTSGLLGDTYFWDFGDGSFSNDENPSHAYSSNGIYTASLLINNNLICSTPDSVFATLQIDDLNILSADFSYTGNCDDSLVLFVNTGSTDSPLTHYFWYFGDGLTSTLENPNHQYMLSSIYNVTLITSDNGLCSIFDTIQIPVNVDYGLDVIADFNFIESCDDTTVSVFNTGTTGSSNIQYLWDMGDNSFYNQVNVNHQYNQPGNYIITFQLTDIFCNVTDSYTHEIELLPSLIADFLVIPATAGCAPFEVQFINSSNITSGASISWDFGNNIDSSNTQNPIFIYHESATSPYNVTLLLSDPESCNLTDEETIQITVVPGIDVEFIPEVEICEGESIELNAENPGNNYEWNNGENTQFIEIDEQGTYSVVVSNAYCSDSSSTFLTVFEHPSLNYSIGLCPEQSMVLSALPNGSQYQWNTGETTPDIIINTSGTYWNSYLDKNLCDRADTIQVGTIDESEQVFIPNSFTPTDDGLNDTWKVYGGGLDNGFELQVFNRWGYLIWETKDIHESWDGTFNGTILEPGMYVYKLYFFSECYGSKIETIGTILLLN